MVEELLGSATEAIDSDDTESSANEDEESPREDEIPVSAADPVFAILEARLSVSAGLV